VERQAHQSPGVGLGMMPAGEGLIFLAWAPAAMDCSPASLEAAVLMMVIAPPSWRPDSAQTVLKPQGPTLTNNCLRPSGWGR